MFVISTEGTNGSSFVPERRDPRICSKRPNSAGH
jgi:hypothetical protein